VYGERGRMTDTIAILWPQSIARRTKGELRYINVTRVNSKIEVVSSSRMLMLTSPVTSCLMDAFLKCLRYMISG
jgi:hypothetical protein